VAASLRSVAAKAHFTGPRRRQILIYLGIAAITSLTSGNAFSNPGHKPVASHQNKTVKAELASAGR
jgi:hypothetical protein